MNDDGLKILLYIFLAVCVIAGISVVCDGFVSAERTCVQAHQNWHPMTGDCTR